MAATQTLPSIQTIQDRIAPLRQRLSEHSLYASLRTPEDIRVFMKTHVFAVWDFMSLLKTLQARLTCVAVPWVPTGSAASRRFINEIVLGEESDVYEGRAVSHFELYLEAMQAAGADTTAIHNLLSDLTGTPVLEAVRNAVIPEGARSFLIQTFELIEAGKIHALAAAFTFGREDVIPDLFRGLVRELNEAHGGAFGLLLWYLERHIEVDGEDHGPLSLRMVADLCGTDEAKWEEAALAAEDSLKARLTLWDNIHAQVVGQRSAA